jgi:FtsH-binding integral membrane protein
MPNRDETWYESGLSVAERSSLLAKVAGLLAFAMVFTTLGAIVGVSVPALSLPALIGVLILAIALMFARNVTGLNLILMYLLTTLMGVGVGGIIAAYLQAGAGIIVVQAAATTAVLTLCLAVYALTTKRDLSSLGGKLIIALLGLIAASIVGIFVQATILQIVIGLAGAVIFSLYLVYAIQQARFAEDTLPNAILIAVGIYIALINLFLSLLQLLTAVQGRRE